MASLVVSTMSTIIFLIVSMLDPISSCVEPCRKKRIARQSSDHSQEVEVVVDSFAPMAAMTVIGRRASREEQSRSQHITKRPDCRTHSFRRMHQVDPPSLDSANRVRIEGDRGFRAGGADETFCCRRGC